MSKVPAKLRQKVIDRAKGFCEYCRTNSAFSQDPFDIEHISPVSDEGTTSLSNLALACHGCNLYKTTKTAGYDDLSGESVRLFNPRIDVWKEHFAWTKNFTVIIGLTPIGRVSVSQLRMNREGLINQRKIFHLFGIHPPEIR